MASEGAANTAIRLLRGLGRVIPAISLLLRCQRVSFPQGLCHSDCHNENPFQELHSLPSLPHLLFFSLDRNFTRSFNFCLCHSDLMFFKLVFSSSLLFYLTLQKVLWCYHDTVMVLDSNTTVL